MNDLFSKQSVLWDEMIKDIFPICRPSEARWTSIVSMVTILSEATRPNLLNHMFLPDGGGMDLISASWDSGYIYLKTDLHAPYVFEPEYLDYFGFNNPALDCFYIKAKTVAPLTDTSDKYREEMIISNDSFINLEDYQEMNPDIYIDDVVAIEKRGGLRVYRYFNGGFLIVPKMGLYNQCCNSSYSPLPPAVTYSYLHNLYAATISGHKKT